MRFQCNRSRRLSFVAVCLICYSTLAPDSLGAFPPPRRIGNAAKAVRNVANKARTAIRKVPGKLRRVATSVKNRLTPRRASRARNQYQQLTLRPRDSGQYQRLTLIPRSSNSIRNQYGQIPPPRSQYGQLSLIPARQSQQFIGVTPSGRLALRSVPAGSSNKPTGQTSRASGPYTVPARVPTRNQYESASSALRGFSSAKLPPPRNQYESATSALRGFTGRSSASMNRSSAAQNGPLPTPPGSSRSSFSKSSRASG